MVRGRQEKKRKEKKRRKKIMIMREKKRKEIMEQNISMLSEDERQVVELLVELPRVILDLDVVAVPLPFTWGRKRRRSAIQVTPTTPCPPPPPPLHHGGAAVVAPPCEASSPATPLSSFSLTESDDKTKKPLQMKASFKRKREYYLKIIEDLTKSKASLNQEVDNVKRYGDQLKAFNLMLKARKQELSDGLHNSKCKNPSLGIGWPMQLVNASVNSSNSMAENQQQQVQLQMQVSSTPHYVALMLNQTSGPSQKVFNSEGIAQFHCVSSHRPTTPLPMPSSSSSTSALSIVNTSNMGPLGILDLNFSPEEFIQVDSCQPSDVTMANKDLSRAMAAQARQRRIQINRLKNPIGNSKPRYSYR